MNKPLGFPFGFFVNDNTPDSGKYFNRETGRPYVDMAEALALLPEGIRHEGLTINIAGVEYWWPADVEDLSLDPVIKNTSISEEEANELIGEALENNILSKISSLGDSITFGTGASTDNNYPKLLSELTGYSFFNGGVPGDTSTQIKNRFLLLDSKYKKNVIIWAGRNNYTQLATVVSDIQDMVADVIANEGNYVVLSVLNGDYVSERSGGADYNQLIALNNELKSLFGSRYIEVREYLVSLYNPGIPKDVSDFEFDIVPTSLRSDNIHLNNAGYFRVAECLKRHFSKISGDGVIEATNLRSGGMLQVTGSSLPIGVPVSSLELFYSGGQGYIGAYNRNNSTPLPLNIGSYIGAIVNINPLGGTLNIAGDILPLLPDYAENGVAVVGQNIVTGRLERILLSTSDFTQAGLNISINYESGQMASGNVSGFMSKDNQTFGGVKTFSSDALHVRKGTQPGVTLGYLDANWAYIQSRTEDIGKGLKIFGANFEFNGGVAKYSEDYSASYDSRSLIDKGYADATYVKVGTVAPLNATDTGTTGEIRITSDYIYTCIATNTWVRAAVSTW